MPQTNADYSDRVTSIDEKISIFKEFDNAHNICLVIFLVFNPGFTPSYGSLLFQHRVYST